MDYYQLGRDIESLNCRIKQLEADCRVGGHGNESIMAPAGHIAHNAFSAGIDAGMKPLIWKPEEASHLADLPPWTRSALRLPINLDRQGQFNIKPESKTWTCVPEPLIVTVYWSAGGSDEFYRLSDQVFSVIRYTDPNSGVATCSVLYNATLKASGRGKSAYHPAVYQNGLSIPEHTDTTDFNIFVLGTGGNILSSHLYSYIVRCKDDYVFQVGWPINPGLYDLVEGARWTLGATGVDRC